jgi:hypothetical protein
MIVSSKPVAMAGISNEPEATEFADGFKRVEAEIRALPEAELVPVNIDVQGAVTTVLGALPELSALRPELVELKDFDLASFDKLRDYSLALGYTHAMYRVAAGPSDSLTALATELTELRDMLEADATALAKRGILDEAQVSKLRDGSGYKNIAFEVVGLVGLLRDRWDAIQGRSAISETELEHAGQLAQELVTKLGVREQAPAVAGAAAVLRQRAFTLFANTYDEVRRAVSYLRWHENDVDEIAPSLFAGRGGRGAPPDPATDSTVPYGTPIVTPPAAPVAPTTAAPAVGVGLPAADPFRPSATE